LLECLEGAVTVFFFSSVNRSRFVGIDRWIGRCSRVECGRRQYMVSSSVLRTDASESVLVDLDRQQRLERLLLLRSSLIGFHRIKSDSFFVVLSVQSLWHEFFFLWFVAFIGIKPINSLSPMEQSASQSGTQNGLLCAPCSHRSTSS